MFKNYQMFHPLQGVDSSISTDRIERRYESLETYDRVCSISFEHMQESPWTVLRSPCAIMAFLVKTTSSLHDHPV